MSFRKKELYDIYLVINNNNNNMDLERDENETK
jgi:hypothetical protein